MLADHERECDRLRGLGVVGKVIDRDHGPATGMGHEGWKQKPGHQDA